MSPAEDASQDFFDSQAAEWDAKPHHRAMAERAVEALLRRVHLSPESSSVLEFGCGTGLCSALLLPHAATVVGVDTSAEMVNFFNQKARKLGAADRMQALQLFLERPREQLGEAMPEGGFSLVFSHLTLHHIQDINGIMGTLVQCLNSADGVVAVSDFKNAAHSEEFHPAHVHKEVKHHGICPQKLRTAMEAAGLCDIDVATAFEFEKPVEGGGAKKFEFLVGIGHLQE